RVQETGEGGARRLLALDPVLPRGPLLVPVGEVLLVRRPHRVRQRALGTGVDVHLLLEDREAVTTALGERKARVRSLRGQTPNGQGRPSSGPRAAATRSPARSERVDPSRGRSRGRRS